MTEIVVFEDLTDRFYELYNRGEHGQALDLLARESARFPDSAVIADWWQMRMMALTGDNAGALRVLEGALAHGQWYHEEALHNMPDLAALQGVPRFEDLVARCKERRMQAVAGARPSLTALEPQDHLRPWPLLLPLRAANPDFADYWQPAAHAGWLVAIPRSSQLGWFSGLQVWDNVERALVEIQWHYEELGAQYAFDQDRVVIAGLSKHCQTALKLALGGGLKLSGFIALDAWLPELSVWPPIIEIAIRLLPPLPTRATMTHAPARCRKPWIGGVTCVASPD